VEFWDACLECRGKARDLEIARATNYASYLWTDDPTAIDWMIRYIRSALRYDLMGIIPVGIPMGLTPTIRFGMAADDHVRILLLDAVLYYLANLGTTMESKLDLSSQPLYPVYSCAIYSLILLSPLCASLCAAPPLANSTNPREILDSVAASHSKDRILAVTL